MVAQKGEPSLRGWPISLDHVLGDAGLSDLEAKLEQFAMDARRAPQQIVHAHPSDQRPHIRVDWRPASEGAGFPSPVPAEAGTVPTHDGLWPDDSDCLQDRRNPSVQLDQEQAIGMRPRTFRCSTAN